MIKVFRELKIERNKVKILMKFDENREEEWSINFLDYFDKSKWEIKKEDK